MRQLHRLERGSVFFKAFRFLQLWAEVLWPVQEEHSPIVSEFHISQSLAMFKINMKSLSRLFDLNSPE